jgi:uncharacterized protein
VSSPPAPGADHAEVGRDRQRHRRRATRLSAYFDSSAVVKLLLTEPGSAIVGRAWDAASARSSSVALVAETRAALAAARRARRLDDDELRSATESLEALWAEIDGLAVTVELARRAGELAERCALRGYDAIHLASAEAILEDGGVIVVCDVRLAEAAASIGLEALVPTGS